jgi:hypothetical protein
MKLTILSLFLISISCFLISGTINSQEKVQAKIGVMLKSGNQITKAKSKDRIKSGDELKVVVEPQNDCIIYAVYNDGKEATLLNFSSYGKTLKKEITEMLPNEEEFYQVDDKSSNAKITVICSIKKITEIDKLFRKKDTAPSGEWVKIEDKLLNENKANLNEESDKPFQIAGNVRGFSDDFKKKLPVFTSDKLIIKSFVLEIKR